MEGLPKDVFVHHICIYFDGKTVARMYGVNRYFKHLIERIPLAVRLMKMHHVNLDSVYDFLNEIGNPTPCEIFPSFVVSYGLEGTVYYKERTRSGNIMYSTFNDFYYYGNEYIANQVLKKLRHKNVHYKLIMYRPLGGNNRHSILNLTNIHRGASIFISSSDWEYLQEVTKL